MIVNIFGRPRRIKATRFALGGSEDVSAQGESGGGGITNGKSAAYEPVLHKPGMKKPKNWPSHRNDSPHIVTDHRVDLQDIENALERTKKRKEAHDSYSENFSDPRGNIVPDLTAHRGIVRVGRVYRQRDYTYDPSKHANTIAEHHFHGYAARDEDGNAISDHPLRGDKQVLEMSKRAILASMATGVPHYFSVEVPGATGPGGYPVQQHHIAYPDGRSYIRHNIEKHHDDYLADAPLDVKNPVVRLFNGGVHGNEQDYNINPAALRWAKGGHSPETDTLFSVLHVGKDPEGSRIFKSLLPSFHNDKNHSLGIPFPHEFTGTHLRDSAKSMRDGPFREASSWLARKDLHGSSPGGEHFNKHYFNSLIGHPRYHHHADFRRTGDGEWMDVRDKDGWIDSNQHHIDDELLGMAFSSLVPNVDPDGFVTDGEHTAWHKIKDGVHPTKGIS